MNLTDVAAIRLNSQQIEGGRFSTVKDIVNWMGAMQAQDYAMAKWGTGLRLVNATDRLIETAINNAELLRTHLIRGTWHFVSAGDIYWMLALRAEQIKASLKTRHKQLGLTEDILTRSNLILEKALRDGHQLTRDDILTELGKAKIVLDENRASHIMLRAEMDGLVCSGAIQNGKLTYALLEDWVPKTGALTKDEALAKFAGNYFNSHGPATLQDFAWWSGLSAGEARHAIEMVKANFAETTIDSAQYWYREPALTAPGVGEGVHWLPAFDEYIISYRDRQAMLPLPEFNKVVSNNGIFRPVIVVNGQVVGVWRRTSKRDKVIVEAVFFNQTWNTRREEIEQAALRYGKFLEKEVEIKA